MLTKCCKDKLNLADAKLSDEYYYNSLPLCIIDAVFSIGINYNATRNVVINFCKKQNIERFRKNGSAYPERDQQFSVKDLIELYDKNSLDDITNKYYGNQCRTSPRNGILKSEAVILFCDVLDKYRVNHFQDLSEVVGNREFEGDIKEIPGQGSGISTNYFYMLAGDVNFIKPDRMIIRFVESCIGSSGLKPDEVTKLIMDTHKELVKEFPPLTPRGLDYQIWRFQSNQKKDKDTQNITNSSKSTSSEPKKVLSNTTNMKIRDKMDALFANNKINQTFHRKQIIDMVLAAFPGTCETSVIPSDYCYNRINKGIKFDHHLFECLDKGTYKVLGKNYLYEGAIFWENKKTREIKKIGEWRKGSSKPIFYKEEL